VPTGIACFYENANYAGAATCADADSSWVGGTWNDRFSSVKVRAGYKVQLFNDINYGGGSVTLTGDTPNLGTVGFNDLASSFKITTNGTTLPTSDTPDFGPNVSIFEPSTPIDTIRTKVNSAFDSMNKSSTAQFGGQRFTFLFKPGTYNDLWINLGFYTTVAGLGQNPDDVRFQNGAINVDSGWNLGDEKNATQNFWRSAENLSIVPNGGTNREIRGGTYLNLSAQYDITKNVQLKLQALNVTNTQDIMYKGGYDSIAEVSRSGPQYFFGFRVRL
jgi:hypothetical protein